jgi:hypothetical protein
VGFTGGGGLVHIGYGPNWKIWVSLESPFCGDSKSGVLKFVTFLIRLENPKQWWNPSGLKIRPPPNWMVQQVPRPIFQGDCEYVHENVWLCCGICYTQNSDCGRRSRLGDLLWLISFKVVLDPNLEGILNPQREIWNSHCASQYSKIGDSGRRSRLGDFHQLILFKVVLDPNLEGNRHRIFISGL